MKRIFLSLIVIVMAGAAAIGATQAVFSDTETSNNNTFTAGSLDLKINGGDTNVTLFNESNMKPYDQPTGHITLKNDGSILGNLSISGVVVTSFENGCLDPEVGDPSCDNPGVGMGELQNVLGFTFYLDMDKDGYFSTGDIYLYNGMMSGLPSTIAIAKTLAPNEEVQLNYVVNWWSTASDNLAQSDGVKLDMTFGLAQ